MKKILKIVAVLCASALLVGIGFVSNMFLGNPISYYLAYNSAKKYIEENYKDTDYQVERVAYNFKFADYMAEAGAKEITLVLVSDAKNVTSIFHYKWIIREMWNLAIMNTSLWIVKT